MRLTWGKVQGTTQRTVVVAMKRAARATEVDAQVLAQISASRQQQAAGVCNCTGLTAVNFRGKAVHHFEAHAAGIVVEQAQQDFTVGGVCPTGCGVLQRESQCLDSPADCILGQIQRNQQGGLTDLKARALWQRLKIHAGLRAAGGVQKPVHLQR